ncbi:MAG: PspC domain-containing protein [Actinomycetes bacterium]
MTSTASPDEVAPAVPRLTRASSGRMVGGVARGIAEHLRVDVWWVRGAFVGLAFIGGSGFLAYAILWALVPLDSKPRTSGAERPVMVDGRGAESSLLLVLGATGVVLGGLLLASIMGMDVGTLWPLAVAGLGAALIWLRADDGQRERLRSGVEGRRSGPLQIGLGAVLVLVGLIAFGVGGVGLGQAGALLAAVVVVVVGIALVVSPFALRLWRDRDAERRARIRSEERAEIAAQVHDSVLQTLNLIQRNASDAQAVSRIARAQERDLRRWLYPDPSPLASSFRVALEEMAADVEDTYGVRVDVVCVGDVVSSEPLSALLQATREALANAGRHSGAEAVSVYAEMTDVEVTVHVRDRGVGFVLSEVPTDRMGVRESILGRLERHGGRASVTSEPGEGTRIELVMETP